MGMGRIGENVTRLLLALGVKEIWYWNRTRKQNLEQELSIKYVDPQVLLSECDVISNHLSSDAGEVFNKDLLARTKQGMLFINTGAHTSFDLDALLDQLTSNQVRAAFDVAGGLDQRFKSLPLSVCYTTNEGAGYNTRASLKMASDMTTDSVINILTTGIDQHKVN